MFEKSSNIGSNSGESGIFSGLVGACESTIGSSESGIGLSGHGSPFSLAIIFNNSAFVCSEICGIHFG